MQFVDAERAAEVLQDLAAMLGHVELADAIAEHVVDEPGGEVEEDTRGGATAGSARRSCRP